MAGVSILDDYAAGFVRRIDPIVSESEDSFVAREIRCLLQLLLLIKNEFLTRLVLSPHTIPILMKHAETKVKDMLFNDLIIGPNGATDCVGKKRHFYESLHIYNEMQHTTSSLGIITVQSCKSILDVVPNNNTQSSWLNGHKVVIVDWHFSSSMSRIVDSYYALVDVFGNSAKTDLENVFRFQLQERYYKNCIKAVRDYLDEAEDRRSPGDTNYAKDPSERVDSKVYLEMIQIAGKSGWRVPSAHLLQ